MSRITINRVLLAFIGLVLLALGVAVLIGSLDLQRHWDFHLPSSWPFSGSKDVLLTRHDRRLYRHRDWWWPVVIAGLAVIFLISLWWLLAQFRTRRLRQLRIDSGDGQGSLIGGRALENVLAAEAEAYPGVEWAGAVLVAPHGQPQARLVLGLAPDATPVELVAGLDAEVLAHARDSAGLAELPTEARLRAVRHRASRVS